MAAAVAASAVAMAAASWLLGRTENEKLGALPLPVPLEQVPAEERRDERRLQEHLHGAAAAPPCAHAPAVHLAAAVAATAGHVLTTCHWLSSAG